MSTAAKQVSCNYRLAHK